MGRKAANRHTAQLDQRLFFIYVYYSDDHWHGVYFVLRDFFLGIIQSQQKNSLLMFDC